MAISVPSFEARLASTPRGDYSLVFGRVSSVPEPSSILLLAPGLASAIRPETVRLHRAIGVHLHPGIQWEFRCPDQYSVLIPSTVPGASRVVARIVA
jgi:hypothetical protein